jgi:predicted nucleic acid-binding Zn ribbon protein
MIARLNKALGGKVLTDIHFKASGLSKKKKPAPTLDVFVTPVPSEDDLARVKVPLDAQKRIEEAIAGIKEEAWRMRIRRAMLRAARTEQWKREHGWEACARCGTLTYPTPVSTLPLICPLCHAGAV